MSKEDDDKLEAELKEALKRRKEAEPVARASKRIKVQSKNGKKDKK